MNGHDCRCGENFTPYQETSVCAMCGGERATEAES